MSYKKIKTYEDACKVNKQDPKQLPDVTGLPEHEAKDVITTLMLKRVIRALNTNQKTGKVWEPNWNDRDEVKYSPWVEVKASEDKPGGFGFSRSGYVTWYTLTIAGSRLCLDSSDKVYHLFKHFNELMVEYYLIVK